MTAPPSHVVERCQSIRILLLDVDGVLTDGSLIYGLEGEEVKVFHVRDGLGIRMALAAGIRVGVVTGRGGKALERRCREVGVDLIFEQMKNKALVLDAILARQAQSASEIAFMGDDLIDLPLLRRVGLPIAVADAHPEVRRAAAWTTRAAGGRGAVREVCEGLLHAQQRWNEIRDIYAQ